MTARALLAADRLPAASTALAVIRVDAVVAEPAEQGAVGEHLVGAGRLRGLRCRSTVAPSTPGSSRRGRGRRGPGARRAPGRAAGGGHPPHPCRTRWRRRSRRSPPSSRRDRSSCACADASPSSWSPHRRPTHPPTTCARIPPAGPRPFQRVTRAACRGSTCACPTTSRPGSSRRPRARGCRSTPGSCGRPPAPWNEPADLSALSTRNFDSSTFNAWYTAFTLDDPEKQAVAERRFRPEFKVAFDAWMATDPFHNPDAPPGPTYMPQYRLADQAKAEELDREAVAAAEVAHHAGVVGDEYIRITVFLAAVLFLVGIGSSFKLHTIRYALIGVGSLLLVLATGLILQQPRFPG